MQFTTHKELSQIIIMQFGKNYFCREDILSLKMSTTLVEPFLVKRHQLHQNEVLILNDRSPSFPAVSSSSAAAHAEVSAPETSVLCVVRRMSEAPSGSKKGEDKVRMVDGGSNVKEKSSAGRGGSRCREKTTTIAVTGGSEQRSFREKILAFEEFSSQNTGQKGCSRRWTRPFSSSSSSSSASKTFRNLPSTEKDTDKKRYTKEADNGNKNGTSQAEQTTQQQQQQEADDRNDNGKTSKPHWTVRLSQRLLKIRGKLEQRCHSSEHRTQTTTKRSKEEIGSSVVTGASPSNVFQIESSSTSDLSLSNQDRGFLISRSCSELSQAADGGSDSMFPDGDQSELHGEKRNPESGVRFAMTKHHTQSAASDAEAGVVEKATTGDEMAEDGKSKQNGTKSSFISELRRFYDRSCSDKKSVQRRFFKGTSKKNKQSNGCEDASEAGTYIEADRIDWDILTPNSVAAGPITSSIDSTNDETRNETALVTDVCDIQKTIQPCNTDDDDNDDSKDVWTTDRRATPASKDKNGRRPPVIGDNGETTTAVTENNNGTAAIASNGRCDRNVRIAREEEAIIEAEVSEVKTDVLNGGRRCLHPDREIESFAKSKKQVTPVPWRKPLSPPPPLAVFSTSTRDPPPELHCKAIVEEWRQSESSNNRIISPSGK